MTPRNNNFSEHYDRMSNYIISNHEKFISKKRPVLSSKKEDTNASLTGWMLLAIMIALAIIATSFFTSKMNEPTAPEKKELKMTEKKPIAKLHFFYQKENLF